MPADRHVLCVSLHDVAPATLDDCRATLGFLDAMHAGPVALLVVPNYHHLGRIDRDERFCEFLRAREQRGDEIVLHGYWHEDDLSGGLGLRDHIERRIYTAGEGEFARLDEETARTRILRGLAVLRAAGWSPSGFVPPAWLMSAGTRSALAGLPFDYCATRDAVISITRDVEIAAPSLVVSTRSTLRRALSPLWNQWRLRRQLGSQVLRAALHPRDLRYPPIAALWHGLLDELAGREILTEGRLIAGA
jgi:predicted deacetylase